jgi:hypothetical protein
MRISAPISSATTSGAIFTSRSRIHLFRIRRSAKSRPAWIKGRGIRGASLHAPPASVCEALRRKPDCGDLRLVRQLPTQTHSHTKCFRYLQPGFSNRCPTRPVPEQRTPTDIMRFFIAQGPIPIFQEVPYAEAKCFDQ